MRALIVLALLVTVGAVAAPSAQAVGQADLVISSVNPSTARVLGTLSGTFTVTNIGTAAASTVVGIAVEPPGETGPQSISAPTNGAAIAIGPCTGCVNASLSSLAPGASFSANYGFGMTTSATTSLVVKVTTTTPQPTDNDTVTQSITVTGLDMTTGPIFPDTELGLLSPSQRVTITNRAQFALTPGAASFSGAGADDFLVLPNTNTCTGSLVPDATCSFTMRFAPSALGARAATLTLPTQFAGTRGDYPLTANGVPRQVNTGPAGPTGPQGLPGADGQPASKLLLALVSRKLRARAGSKVPLAFADTIAGPVSLDVLKGTKTVATVKTAAKVGANTVTWNGRVAHKKRAAPGHYTLRLTAKGASQTAIARVALTLTR